VTACCFTDRVFSDFNKGFVITFCWTEGIWPWQFIFYEQDLVLSFQLWIDKFILLISNMGKIQFPHILMFNPMIISNRIFRSGPGAKPHILMFNLMIISNRIFKSGSVQSPSFGFWPDHPCQIFFIKIKTTSF
jgi:hypothetical protein